jgi:hypothetical protein
MLAKRMGHSRPKRRFFLQLLIHYLRSEGFNRKLICKAKSKAQRLPAWR